MENNDNLREQAVANIAFRVHALIYLLVNSGLLVIDLLFDNSSILVATSFASNWYLSDNVRCVFEASNDFFSND